MNFLAHLFLSDRNEALLIGNFLGDFIRNRDLPAYAPEVQFGVRLHRKIDEYTDNHPIVLQGTRRLYARHRRYAAVLIDIYYDFLLSKNWLRYSDEKLEDFSRWVYSVLANHLPNMPPAIRKTTERMISGNFINSYTSLGGIAHTLDRVATRASKPELIHGALESMHRDEDKLQEEFIEFFPDVQNMAKEFIKLRR